MSAERFTCTGNSRSWQFHSGSKAKSSLGGAFENARIITRIGMGPALAIAAFIGVPATFAIIAIGG